MFFKGSYVAMITPFKSDGTIDEEKIRELVNFHIENGTSGISPCGTTGESPTLTLAEHKKVVELVVEEADGRIEVVAGAGANSTKEAVELTKHAKEVGADAVLSICPYYNKPGQKGLIAHFTEINKVGIPVMLYNVPGRTGINMEPETTKKLSELTNIKGIKEAAGSVEQVSNIVNICDEDFDVISGDDSLLLPMMSVGAKGVVSVLANFMPKEVSDLIKYVENGEFDKAKDLHHKLYKLNKAMFCEPNPVPVKEAMSILGKINPNVRLPLTKIDIDNSKLLKKLMKKVEII
ncbi:MAG: 4-hydroxy-tetrahydrodipicolinate synthase [Fusobacteriota bacterium]